MTPSEQMIEELGEEWIAVNTDLVTNLSMGVSVLYNDGIDGAEYRAFGAMPENAFLQHAYAETALDAFSKWVDHVVLIAESAKSAAEYHKSMARNANEWLEKMERIAERLREVDQ